MSDFNQTSSFTRWLQTLAILLVVTAVVTTTTATQADLLDFENLGLSNFDPIPLTYGDTPMVDVSHQVRDGFGSGSNTIATRLSFWDFGYGDLVNVAWSTTNNATHVGELRIDAVSPSGTVTLDFFELAGWQTDQTGKEIRIYDESWKLLANYTNQTISGVSHNSYFPALSASSLIVQWDHPWAVAIDNINFSAIPEPSSIAFAGVLVLGLAIQNRRRGAF